MSKQEHLVSAKDMLANAKINLCHSVTAFERASENGESIRSEFEFMCGLKAVFLEERERLFLGSNFNKCRYGFSLEYMVRKGGGI